jgi:putrescine transport system substrate-binding protein
LLDEAVSGDPDIYPGPELRARLFAEQALPLREMRQRTRLWTAFRTQY